MTRLRLRFWTRLAWAAAKLADWALVRRAKACGCWAERSEAVVGRKFV